MGASVHAEAHDPTVRLWVSGGAAFRDHEQRTPEGDLFVRIGGAGRAIAPWNLHLSGAVFFNRFLGLNLEARSEHFFAAQSGTPLIPQSGAGLTLAFAGRYRALPWLSVEGQLGWGLQLRSIILPGPRPADTTFTGPSFGAAVELSPSKHLVAQLFFRAQPVNFSLQGLQGFQAGAYAGGAQLALGALRIGDAQLGGAVTFEVASSRFSSVAGSGRQTGVRLGFGLSLRDAADEAVVPTTPVDAKVTLTGKLVSAEGAAIAGAVVTLDGEQPVATDAAGAFSFAGVVRGGHVLRARKDGFKPGLLDVQVKATPEPVTLRLAASTGPGRIRGVLRSEEKPVVGAAVVSGTTKTVSDREGLYVLEGVGPGPVNVQVKAAGFNDAEELAQVPAEAEATLDFTLVPKAVEVRATLRGLIRSKSGAPLKGTVRVVELKRKLTVSTDGRFSTEIPSGKYTLIIEARGYVSQTKTVEVSGGDQAIFHAELERAR